MATIQLIEMKVIFADHFHFHSISAVHIYDLYNMHIISQITFIHSSYIWFISYARHLTDHFHFHSISAVHIYDLYHMHIISQITDHFAARAYFPASAASSQQILTTDIQTRHFIFKLFELIHFFKLHVIYIYFKTFWGPEKVKFRALKEWLKF